MRASFKMTKLEHGTQLMDLAMQATALIVGEHRTQVQAIEKLKDLLEVTGHDTAITAPIASVDEVRLVVGDMITPSLAITFTTRRDSRSISHTFWLCCNEKTGRFVGDWS